jgi:hypothetical protein
VGAAVFRLLEFFLDKWFGESASFLLGVIYVLLVLFVPYGIVGTWRMRSWQVKQGRNYLVNLLAGGAYKGSEPEEDEPEEVLDGTES